MYSPIPKFQEPVKEETWPGIPLTRADLNSVLRMFVNTFGMQPLRDHPDLKRHYHFEDLVWWETAIALQIAVDTTAECDTEDERVAGLKQRFRELLGPCKNETLVRIYTYYCFIVERPPAPF